MSPALPAPIARILAVTEPGTAAETLPAAAALAARHGARLDVLSCLVPPPDLAALARAAGLSPDEIVARLAAERRERMAEALADALPGTDVPAHVAVGKPFLEVIRHVLHHRIDLVVKPAERFSGLHGLLFTSTDQHLLRKCPCPVWLRVPGAAPAPRTVLAAVDVDDWDATEPETLDDLNRRVIETAMRLARGPDAEVHVLHAWEAVGEGMIWAFASGPDPRAAAESYVNDVDTARRRALAALVQPFRGRGPGAPRLVERLVRGPARAVIAEAAQALGADAVVLGTVARTGLGGVIIGNTAEDILNTVDCSVVAVKPGAYVSPLAADLAPPPEPPG